MASTYKMLEPFEGGPLYIVTQEDIIKLYGGEPIPENALACANALVTISRKISNVDADFVSVSKKIIREMCPTLNSLLSQKSQIENILFLGLSAEKQVSFSSVRNLNVLFE